MTNATQTTDHTRIRKWAEERGGKPARVAETGGKRGGVLRIDFGEPEESLERISWEDFFDTFDRNTLALLLQDKTADGSVSRFCKFVSRDAEK